MKAENLMVVEIKENISEGQTMLLLSAADRVTLESGELL